MTDENQQSEQPTDAPEEDFEAMLQKALGVTSHDEVAGLEFTPAQLDQTDLPPGHKSGYVAVVGRPNVGKSTLVNTIIGEKIAIVSPKPQTTRLQQLGIYTRDDVQIIFVDTPGIHKPQNSLGEFMVDMAINALRDADLVLFMTDISEPLDGKDRNIAERIHQAGDRVKMIRIINKIDDHKNPETYQADVEKHLALVPYVDWTTTIATQAKGIGDLLNRIIEHLPEGPRFYPPEQVSDMKVRDMVAEIVREAVLYNTRDEIPHSVATLVEEFKERENGVVYIACNIYVERDSQKRIIIGKGGQMVKHISTRARHESQELIEKKIFLDLHVKVMKNWRRDEQMLQRLGYRIGQ